MSVSERSMKPIFTTDAASRKSESKIENKPKPPFRPAKDDSKPLLQDPILRSDPIETEEAVLRLPPFPASASTTLPKTS